MLGMCALIGARRTAAGRTLVISKARLRHNQTETLPNFRSPCAADRGRDVLILRDRTMNSSILRIPKSTPAVQDGFFAAGLPIAGIAVVQSFVIVLSWIVSAVI
jgi:hypothetical protein